MTAVVRPWPRARIAVPDYQICSGNVPKHACLQFVCATIAQMRFVCAIVAQSRMVEDIHRLFLVLPVAVQLPRRPMLAGMHDCVSSVTAYVSPPRARVILDAREPRSQRVHCERKLYRKLYRYHAVLAQAQLAYTDCLPPISAALANESYLSVRMTWRQHTPSVWKICLFMIRRLSYQFLKIPRTVELRSLQTDGGQVKAPSPVCPDEEFLTIAELGGGADCDLS